MTMGSHQTPIGKSQVHLTPRWILDPLGSFFFDPCASSPRPKGDPALGIKQSTYRLRSDRQSEDGE